MSLETQLTRVMRSKDCAGLLLEFNNGFMLGFEKKDGAIIQEPLDWFGVITPSEFSKDMINFARSRPSESVLCWQRIEMHITSAYKEILNPLNIQTYEERDIKDVLSPLFDVLQFYKFPKTFVQKRAKDLQNAVYSFIFSPGTVQKVSNHSILKMVPSKNCAAFHTNGGVGKYLENFSHIHIAFPSGFYVLVHNPCSKSEYFFADKTNEDWYSKAFCYLPVKQELRNELEHCIVEKHKIMDSWCNFKAKVDKTDFSNLLQGLGYTKNS